MFVSFVLREYDPDQSHVVISREQREVELDQVLDFHAWAAEHWPAPRWRTQLAPGQTPRML